MDHKKVAEVVIKAVGRDNLVAAAHCATRLRLVLKDDSKVDVKMLDADPDIKGTFKTNGQFQVIIGPGDVNNVYDELIKMTGLSPLSTDDLKKVAEKNQKFNPIMSFIKLLSDIFVPIIPALVAAGLLMALNNFLTSPGLFGPKSVIQMVPQIAGASEMIQIMSAAPFIFMPVLVGISAAKRFGANQYLGAAVGMMMTSPNLVDVGTKGGHFWNLFGLHVSQTNYYYQVIPVLVAVWVLAILEKFFHKHLPQAVDFTFTPLLSVFITGFLTFIIIGPVFREVSNWITYGLVWLYNTLGFVGMGIFGALYSPIVMTGLHQSFPAFETQLITAFRNGQGAGDFIFVVASMANIAQGAATFAVWSLTKNDKMKSLASSSGISALLGITEPALFGVNLKLKFPFFCALVGSAVGAAFAGIMKVISVSLGSAGLLGFLSINAHSIPMYLVAELISFVVAFAVTYVYGRSHMALVNPKQEVVSAGEAVEQQQEAEKIIKENKELHDEIIAAPVSGEAKSLTEVNDPVFSTEAMGKGAAIVPSEGTVYSPVSGEITVAYETKHAYGIKSDEGAEVLIHIGIDTVNLKGKNFTSKVKQGQHVEKGDVLGTVDVQGVIDAGYDPTVMVVITNTPSYANVQKIDGENKNHGDDLIAVTKRIIN
ncbi:PTS beta-glucoside transporter subunit IIBCA [Lactobacillus sp. PV037]|uniref:sucrose-specific PTS transporter subunit IIBC n=1 Tax=unclassified Lactobacillus TaxID=2620435 RepID=UPI00223E9C9E|nr:MULTISPECIES: sucrose-specific PTS transporter subunit IIBC [unclassified Lactobacillus]QNQ82832.1 PTS beta-glucoside transporter subunit IIBCA [Lactobacillus sp. PV012]QNQ83045.1 PTS beta-glucoside transporter subunit IIBCA [Lactobacillus sp. PV037]